MTDYNITLSGTVVIACQHGVDKAKISTLVYDSARERLAQCACCLNLFAYEHKRGAVKEPMFCEKCGGNEWLA